jgi:hypothetical protein
VHIASASGGELRKEYSKATVQYLRHNNGSVQHVAHTTAAVSAMQALETVNSYASTVLTSTNAAA